MEKKSCSKCGKEFTYVESEDIANNDLVPHKIRKVIIDPNGLIFPFFALPKDKQKIVNPKLISFVCTGCAK